MRVKGYPTCPVEPSHVVVPFSRCRCGHLARCSECREVRPALARDGRPEHAEEGIHAGLCRACVRREGK